MVSIARDFVFELRLIGGSTSVAGALNSNAGDPVSSRIYTLNVVEGRSYSVLTSSFGANDAGARIIVRDELGYVQAASFTPFGGVGVDFGTTTVNSEPLDSYLYFIAKKTETYQIEILPRVIQPGAAVRGDYTLQVYDHADADSWVEAAPISELAELLTTNSGGNIRGFDTSATNNAINFHFTTNSPTGDEAALHSMIREVLGDIQTYLPDITIREGVPANLSENLITFSSGGSNEVVLGPDNANGRYSSATWTYDRFAVLFYDTDEIIANILQTLGLNPLLEDYAPRTTATNPTPINYHQRYSVLAQARADLVGFGSFAPPVTLQIADLAALHLIYGNGAIVRPEDNIYIFDTGDMALPEPYVFNDLENEIYTPALLIYDQGGEDWFNPHRFNGHQIIDLRPGSFSSIGGKFNNVFIADAPENDGVPLAQRNSLIENARAGAGADVIYGNDVRNKLYGGDGNDLIIALGGSDILVGGNGQDRVEGGPGNDFIYGTETVIGTSAALTLANRYDGGEGFDYVIYSTLDLDPLPGNPAEPLIDLREQDSIGEGFAQFFNHRDVLVNVEGVVGTMFDDEIHGDSQDNYLFGKDGNDRIFGHGGSDRLIGGNGEDELDGGSGRDFFFASETIIAPDSYIGGTDNFLDVVSYENATAPVILRISTSGSSRTHQDGEVSDEARAHVATDPNYGTPATYMNPVTGDTYNSIEEFWGTAHRDYLGGGQDADTFRGLEGNDLIEGYGGNDTLYGNNGNDTLRGGEGNDTLIGGLGQDQIFGNDGNDFFVAHEIDENGSDMPQTDTYSGGNGRDWVSYRYAGSGVDIDLVRGQLSTSLQTNPAYLDLYTGIEGFIGSQHDDIIAVAGADRPQNVEQSGPSEFGYWIDGDAGNDIITGSDYDDFLVGGEGNDTLIGGLGADYLYGHEETAASGPDAFYGHTITAGAEPNDPNNEQFDYISYIRSDEGVFVDLVNGGANINDSTESDSAGDTYQDIEGIVGSNNTNSHDVLIGDNQNNHIFGLDGNDLIRGNAGDDHLIGGAGADSFIFETGHGTNQIWDFNLTEDQIVIVSSTVTDRSALTFSDGSDANGNYVDITGINQTDFNTVLRLRNYTEDLVRSGATITFQTTFALTPASAADSFEFTNEVTAYYEEKSEKIGDDTDMPLAAQQPASSIINMQASMQDFGMLDSQSGLLGKFSQTGAQELVHMDELWPI